MSLARGFPNAGHFYANIVKPIYLNCNFIVDSTNGNGLGLRSIKSNGYIRNIFMHTSATPGTGNDGVVNPNPATGLALIQFKQNFNYYLGGFSGFVSPTSTTLATSTTAGSPYIIANVGASTGFKFTVTSANATQGATYTNNSQTFTVLATISSGTTLYTSGTGAPLASGTLTKATGTGDSTITFSAFTNQGATTLAQWQAAGLPAGLTPTVGQSFIALQTAQIGGSGQVVSPLVSGITSMEVIGDPNQSIANASIAVNGGAYLLVQFLAATSSSVTTLIPTNPANNSVVGMTFFFDGSSVTVDGL